MSIENSSAANGIAVATTKPDKLLRHDISDEELDGVSQMSNSHLVEGMWAAFGACIGVFPATCAAIYNAYFANKTESMGVFDLSQTILCFVSLSVGLVLLYVIKNTTCNVTTLVNEIRSRGTSAE